MVCLVDDETGKRLWINEYVGTLFAIPVFVDGTKPRNEWRLVVIPGNFDMSRWEVGADFQRTLLNTELTFNFQLDGVLPEDLTPKQHVEYQEVRDALWLVYTVAREKFGSE